MCKVPYINMKYYLVFIIISHVSIASIGKLKFVKGSVLVNNKEAKTQTQINNKDTISTKKKSLTIIEFKDGSKIKLSEKSKLVISNYLADKRDVNLKEGNGFFNIIKSKVSKKENFSVKTKTASLGVRGTTFFVSYGISLNNDDTWICVNEGQVDVTAKSTTVLVNAGQGVQVVKGKSPSNPAPLPWTKKLNWNFNSKKDLENKVSIEEAYSDPLDIEYD